MLGLSGNTDNELIDSFTELLRHLNRAFDIALTLKEFGVNNKEFEKHLDKIAAGLRTLVRQLTLVKYQ